MNYDNYPRECWAEIDTAALAENVRILCRHAGRRAIAVIKANGYGHGLARAGRAFMAGGAGQLGVANLSEAMALRDEGIDAPVLIMGVLPPGEMKLAAGRGFEFFVWLPEHIEVLSALDGASVHLKIDTGMGRIGCTPEDAAGLAEAITALAGVTLAGVATHFANADMPDRNVTDAQVRRFSQAVDALAAMGVNPPAIHASNSPGTLYFPDARFTTVRLGIAAYGIAPDTGLFLPDGIRPALAWRARIAATKILPQGHGVSYGGEYRMPANARVGLLPFGYADGFRRSPKNVNTVLVAGTVRPIIGRVCMDQVIVDLEGMDDIMGAEVTMLGIQDGLTISADDLAARWNTNAYDVICGIAARVPRREISI